MTRFAITLALLAFGSSSAAQNLTEENVAKVTAVIEAAIEAHGGEQLEALETLLIEQATTGFAVDQSLKPDPPWDRNRNAGYTAIDLANEQFRVSSSGAGGGFDFDNGTIINGNQSYQFDRRAGTATPIAEPNFDNTSGPFIRVTPALLVRQVQEHSRTAHYLGVADYKGRPHDVVAFSMNVGPSISLYFDQQTHQLTHSERVFPGFGLVEYSFLDYQDVEGIPFNRRFELHVNGDLNLQRENKRVVVNPSLEQHLVLDANLDQVEPLTPDEMSRQEIADGVYLIGGNGTYGLFVEMPDHVVAIGGTGGIGGRIEQLREVVPDKPIRYGVMTHHHSDHLQAVAAYVEQGATVIGATAHAEVIREAAGDGNADKIKIETVAERRVLGSGSSRVELIDIGPTAHTEHLIVAWLPEHGILFEADHFAMPRSGPVGPAVDSTRTFAEALKRHELTPAKLASAHSPVLGTLDDLATALSKRPNRQASL